MEADVNMDQPLRRREDLSPIEATQGNVIGCAKGEGEAGEG
jgi:hypothetical protein